MFAFHASQPPRHLLDTLRTHSQLTEIQKYPIHTDTSKDSHFEPLHGQPPRTIPSAEFDNWRSVYYSSPILTPQEVFSYLFRPKTLRIEYTLEIAEADPPTEHLTDYRPRNTSITGDLLLPAALVILDGDPGTLGNGPFEENFDFNNPFAPDDFTIAQIEHLTRSPTHNYLRGLPCTYRGRHFTNSDLDAVVDFYPTDPDTWPALKQAQFHHVSFRYYGQHDYGYTEDSLEFHRILPANRLENRLLFEIELGIATEDTIGFNDQIPPELSGRLLVIPDNGLPIYEPGEEPGPDETRLNKYTGFSAQIFGHTVPLALIHEYNPDRTNHAQSMDASLTVTVEEWWPLP